MASQLILVLWMVVTPVIEKDVQIMIPDVVNRAEAYAISKWANIST